METNGHNTNGNGHRDWTALTTSDYAEAFARAGAEDIWRSKRLGYPIVIWRDGQVIEIQPEDIPDEWCRVPANSAYAQPGRPAPQP